MTRNIKNAAASVHQRLLQKARDSSRPFNEILQHFAIERFIYRLSRTPHAERFILKGALMFSVWGGQVSRPTMDIDLLGRIDNSIEVIVAAMKDACGIETKADGLSFQSETINRQDLQDFLRLYLSGRKAKTRSSSGHKPPGEDRNYSWSSEA